MKLIIFILFFLICLILFEIFKKNERFNVQTDNQKKDQLRSYFNEIVDLNDYDKEYFGPSCLSRCIRQFGARINFTNCEGYNSLTRWAKEHPTKGYCYRANNNNSFPFICDDDCQKKRCGRDLNTDYSNYNPDKDFTNCKYHGNQCVEKKLNMLSGGGCELSTDCTDCIMKYNKNISAMKAIVDKTIGDTLNTQCDSSS